MKFKGKIFMAGPEVTGTSKRTGKPWMIRELVFEAENNERLFLKANTEKCEEIRELIESQRDAIFDVTYWSSVGNYARPDGSVYWFQDNVLEDMTVSQSSIC